MPARRSVPRLGLAAGLARKLVGVFSVELVWVAQASIETGAAGLPCIFRLGSSVTGLIPCIRVIFERRCGHRGSKKEVNH